MKKNRTLKGTSQNFKLDESKLCDELLRRGYTIKKEQNGYQIINTNSNRIIAGKNFELSFEDLLDFYCLEKVFATGGIL